MWSPYSSCSKDFDPLTINQVATVLCYWSASIVPLPWTLKRSKLANRYEISYGAGGVIRLVDKYQNCNMFYGPAFISVTVSKPWSRVCTMWVEFVCVARQH